MESHHATHNWTWNQDHGKYYRTEQNLQTGKVHRGISRPRLPTGRECLLSQSKGSCSISGVMRMRIVSLHPSDCSRNSDLVRASRTSGSVNSSYAVLSSGGDVHPSSAPAGAAMVGRDDHRNASHGGNSNYSYQPSTPGFTRTEPRNFNLNPLNTTTTMLCEPSPTQQLKAFVGAYG